MKLTKIILLLSLLIVNVCKAEDIPDLLSTDDLNTSVNKPISTEKLPTLTADKKKGTISVYFPDKKETITKPALFGKVKSNKLNMNNYNIHSRFDGITPAGTFPITKIFSWKMNEPILVFIKGTAALGSIHPLWMGNPDQKRVQRLNSETPDDNRITGGCINVDPKFFYAVLDKLPNGVILTILPE